MPQGLRQQFLNLPKPITDWLTSDTATSIIIGINEGLGLEGELVKAIPGLILRLAVKDLKPEKFIPELMKELDLDDNQSTETAKQIYSRILKPIELSFQNNLGIDAKFILTMPAERGTKPIAEPKSVEPAPPPILPAPRIEIKETNEPKPFILHEETPISYPAKKLSAEPVEQKPSLKPSFSYTPPKPPAPKTPERPRPPQVRIEGVEAINYPRKTKTNEIRLVHYSNFRTML